MDVNGVKVLGPLKAEKARVFWRDGTLWIATQAAGGFDVVTVPVPEPPKRRGSGYQATTTSGERLILQAGGCSCKKVAALAAVTQEDLMGVVT